MFVSQITCKSFIYLFFFSLREHICWSVSSKLHKLVHEAQRNYRDVVKTGIFTVDNHKKLARHVAKLRAEPCDCGRSHLLCIGTNGLCEHPTKARVLWLAPRTIRFSVACPFCQSLTEKLQPRWLAALLQGWQAGWKVGLNAVWLAGWMTSWQFR